MFLSPVVGQIHYHAYRVIFQHTLSSLLIHLPHPKDNKNNKNNINNNKEDPLLSLWANQLLSCLLTEFFSNQYPHQFLYSLATLPKYPPFANHFKIRELTLKEMKILSLFDQQQEEEDDRYSIILPWRY